MHLIAPLAPRECGQTNYGCGMSSLWYSCSESEVVKWCGRLPQLQSHRVKRDLMRSSKNYKERLVQQTLLCPAVEAFLTLSRCGILCEYTQRLFPNVIFQSGAYVSACGSLRERMKNDDTERLLHEVSF